MSFLAFAPELEPGFGVETWGFELRLRHYGFGFRGFGGLFGGGGGNSIGQGVSSVYK